MSDLAADPVTGLLLVTNGDLSVVSGDDAIVQDLNQTLGLYLGEWFLDTTQGIPWKQRVLIKNPNLDEIQGTILNAALGVDGVTDIVGFGYQYDSQARALRVTLEAKTTNGTVIKAQADIGANVTQGGA